MTLMVVELTGTATTSCGSPGTVSLACTGELGPREIFGIFGKRDQEKDRLESSECDGIGRNMNTQIIN